MIGEALTFGGSPAVPLAIMALIFSAIFAFFAWDSFGTGDRYDGKVAAYLGAFFTGGAAVAAAFA